MKLRMLIMLLLCAVVFGGIFGMKAMGKKGMDAYFDNMPLPPATISTGVAEQQAWQTELDAPGTLIAVNGAAITTEAAGIVTALHFESGQTVAKGALLAQLDSANQRAELAKLEAQAELANINLGRRQKLFGLEAISKSDVDAAMSEANAAKAAADAQRAMLAQKDIRAPFAGTLGIRQINVGQFLAVGSPIVTLQTLDPIDVDFDLPEQHLGKVSPGFKVTVSSEAYPDRAFSGEVLALEPQVDAATRNFKVRARLPNPDGALRPGQFGRIRLGLPAQKQVVVIPRTALDFSAYGTAVFVLQNRKADPQASTAPAAPGTPAPAEFEVVQRFVQVGTVRGDFVAIESGLAAGEQVATSGLLKLSNGYPVIVNNQNLPQGEMEPKPTQG
ncbi:MAG: efflux RND transporter periplasmic adaptor subunit [Panacagrimonas sp.]